MTMDVVGTCAFEVKLRTQDADWSEGDKEAATLIQAAYDIFRVGTTPSSPQYLPMPATLDFLMLVTFTFSSTGV